MSAPSPPALLLTHWQLAAAPDLAAVILALLYLGAARRVRSGWAAHRTMAFLAASAVILVALQSGVATFDDVLLSAHMVQHLLLLMVAPPLLLAGRPLLLALQALEPSRRGKVARALARTRSLTGPVACLAGFYAVLWTTHLPGFYDAALREPPLHDLEHLLYLTAGLLLFSPVMDADPAPVRRLGGLGRFVYMLAAMPPMAIVGAYLNRDTSLVYSSYGPAAHALGVSAVADQQNAGALMWVAGNTIMVVVGLWAVASAMVAAEHRQRVRETRTGAGGAVS
ncbi:MAG: cytochrome c oxidase assembly protein [Solirubrobacteraceae bacterium]